MLCFWTALLPSTQILTKHTPELVNHHWWQNTNYSPVDGETVEPGGAIGAPPASGGMATNPKLENFCWLPVDALPTV